VTVADSQSGAAQEAKGRATGKGEGKRARRRSDTSRSARCRNRLVMVWFVVWWETEEVSIVGGWLLWANKGYGLRW